MSVKTFIKWPDFEIPSDALEKLLELKLCRYYCEKFAMGGVLYKEETKLSFRSSRSSMFISMFL
jgi:hypothetical protein